MAAADADAEESVRHAEHKDHGVLAIELLANAFDADDLDQFEIERPHDAFDSSSAGAEPAAKLGPQRALFYTEDLGKIEKFRPYALPSLQWIKALRSTSEPEALAKTGNTSLTLQAPTTESKTP